MIKAIIIVLVAVSMMFCTRKTYVQEAEVVKLDTFPDGTTKRAYVKDIGSPRPLKLKIGDIIHKYYKTVIHDTTRKG